MEDAVSDRTAAALNRLGYSADREIDRLTAPLADGVAASVRKHAVKQPNGKSVITPLAYRLILRDVDRLLVTVYGARRGDTGAPMYRAIAAAGQAAHEDPIGRAVAELRGQLRGEPELLKLLEGWD
jgi:hypothetical protein